MSNGFKRVIFHSKLLVYQRVYRYTWTIHVDQRTSFTSPKKPCKSLRPWCPFKAFTLRFNGIQQPDLFCSGRWRFNLSFLHQWSHLQVWSARERALAKQHRQGAWMGMARRCPPSKMVPFWKNKDDYNIFQLCLAPAVKQNELWWFRLGQDDRVLVDQGETKTQTHIWLRVFTQICGIYCSTIWPIYNGYDVCFYSALMPSKAKPIWFRSSPTFDVAWSDTWHNDVETCWTSMKSVSGWFQNVLKPLPFMQLTQLQSHCPLHNAIWCNMMQDDALCISICNIFLEYL